MPVPSVLLPSLKMTVPMGVPEPGILAVTVAVKVTDWPDLEGLSEETTIVAVWALFTLCIKASELPSKLQFPS